jgi:hypothetical protein
MELLLAVLLGAVVASPPLALALWFVIREANKSRATAQARAVAMQTYITELQNRLGAHTWGEFAQLQTVPSHTQQTVTALNSFGENRSEAAFGENESDVIDQFLRDNGIDLEGPTVG